MQRILFTNGRDVEFHVLSEPWAQELTLKSGEVLELICDMTELQEPDNPLNFEVWDDGSGVSIWCPASTALNVIAKDATS